MAIITISMNDNIEQRLRELVKKKIGERKGALKLAIETAVKRWMEEEEQKRIGEEAIALMEKGVYSLKGWKFNREELYD